MCVRLNSLLWAKLRDDMWLHGRIWLILTTTKTLVHVGTRSLCIRYKRSAAHETSKTTYAPIKHSQATAVHLLPHTRETACRQPVSAPTSFAHSYRVHKHDAAIKSSQGQCSPVLCATAAVLCAMQTWYLTGSSCRVTAPRRHRAALFVGT